MAIQVGQRLGPYEILSAIGAGGMGEVYRARDTRLDRIVALKVLPDHLADKPELRTRFEGEARAIASLNHSHICVLHDIGRDNGTAFLVMEYLEGETLAERLKKGPLPLTQVLQFAIEIADALDKAHRKGITHRDLKPGNIMLTKSGAKLLDFGLAKLKQESTPAVSLSQRPTAENGVTAEGTILGTVQYMAPEQVEGKTNEIDARTDIFAFGTVVYEMATGKKAFQGKTQASIIAKILESEPPTISSLQPMTPPALDRVVRKCLRKDPDERWQSARDVTDELKWIAEGGSQVTSVPTAAAKGIGTLGRLAPILSLGIFLLGAAIASLAVWNLKPAPPHSPQPEARFTITLPLGQQLAGLDVGTAVALSPDGSHLAYVATQNGMQQIYLRSMDSLEARPIPGTEGAVEPFFSPDGEWVGFFTIGRLKKVSVNGGATVTLGESGAPRGANWGSEGIIAFSNGGNPLIQQLSSAGGTFKKLTHIEKGEVSQRWPEFLPGGKALVFSSAPSTGNWNTAQVAAQSIVTGERRNLVQGATQPRYALSGHLVYAQGGNLMAVSFDPQRLTVMGVAIPVVEGVVQSTSTGAAQYSISGTGSLVYLAGGVRVPERKFVWVNRNGAEQSLNAPARAYDRPRLSPDGQQVAVTITEPETQVWISDLSRDTLTRLTFEGNENQLPSWTPDGKRIAFRSSKDGFGNIFWQRADGGGGLEQLTTGEYSKTPNSWSTDGQRLAFLEINPITGLDLWVLRLGDASAGSGQVRKAEPFLQTPFSEAAPQFSPDGHWLAYVSDESGHVDVYVQPYPGLGGKWQISTEGGTEPMWNHNGRELFYRTGNKMMAVDIATQPSFTVGKPRVLFEGPYVPSPASSPNYDVSPDGQRFLMLKPSEQAEAAPTQINVVLNWFEELKQKVPTGKK